MSLRKRLASIFSPTPAAPAVTEAGPSNDQLKQQLAYATDRKDTLEALLWAKGDPDANLKGGQSQSLFRALSGSTDNEGRDLVESKRHQVLALAHETYAHRGIAHNLIEIALDFVIGDGFKPVAKDPKNTKLQELLDTIWTDLRNRLQQKHEDYARTLYLEGERFISVDLSPVDGHLELGYIPPETVKTVKRDELGRDVFLDALPLVPGAEPRQYFILDNLSDQIEIKPLPTPGKPEDGLPRYEIVETIVGRTGDASTVKTQRVYGLAFAWFENRPDGASRGRSDLLEVLDYIDIHDELLWNDLEISKLLRLFLLDVSVEGIASPAEAGKKLEELGLVSPPQGPKVICHNEKVEVELLQGSIAKTASEKLEQIVALNIYGAKGMPEHWRGSGSDTNLATAQAQELVPMKRMRRKQDRLIERFHRLVEVSIELRDRAGSISGLTDVEFTIQRTEVGGKDKTRGATVLKDVVQAMTMAKQDGLITREAANAVVVQTIRDVGFELDEELAEVPEDDPSADVAKLQQLLDEGGGKEAGDGEERVRGAA